MLRDLRARLSSRMGFSVQTHCKKSLGTMGKNLHLRGKISCGHLEAFSNHKEFCYYHDS